MDNRHMQIDPGIQRRLDLCLFGLLAMGIILFLAHGCQAVTAAWDWQALFRAFFRLEEGQGIVAGPLGRGLITTLRLAAWTFGFSLLFGFVLGLVRSLCARPLRMFGAVIVALTRNLPPLVLVFIIHYFLSGALAASLDWQWTARLPGAGILLPEASGMPVFVSAVITLSLYEGAYIGEIVRAGVAGVAREQWTPPPPSGFPARPPCAWSSCPRPFASCSRPWPGRWLR